MMKKTRDFNEEFDFFLNKFKKNENFNLLRFSDGELYIMLGKSISLGNFLVTVGGRIRGFVNHNKWDKKFFNPKKNKTFTLRLIESFQHKSSEYFVGRNCPCCISKKEWDEESSLLGYNTTKNITSTNVLLNSNYPRFMNEFYPEIKKKGAYVICNEMADLNDHSWIKGDFRIKNNDFMNLEPLEKIKIFIKSNKIKNEVFLFSASSFSNIAQYELGKLFPENTYIDIGTTLSYEFKIPAKRDYLDIFYKNKNIEYRNCKWSTKF